MANTPTNLKYSKDHEWAKVEGKTVTVGITDHAQSSLGDVVYLDLPKVGRELKKGETFGVVESIKAVSDLYAPVAGKVSAVNSGLADQTGSINTDPYGSWMIKLDVTDAAAATSELMDASAYQAYVSSLS